MTLATPASQDPPIFQAERPVFQAERPVRVRYAPSPTGLQHIGGVRTALFNYLFARSSSGNFILRIEDTDRVRSEERYIQDLFESLEWLGIQADEGPEEYGFPGGAYGPYIQSQRTGLYRQHVRQLLDQGKAYHCFCSTERLVWLRREQECSKSRLQGYDRHCRGLEAAEVQRRLAQGQSHVVRFALPQEGSTTFSDLLLGDIKRANSDINPDPVILKADGFPTYHLANVIDDHLMQISHVLRAQEWLSSGPLHLLLYRAFGWVPPKFCHLPMVMGKDLATGKLAKLSKRHGSTSLIEFRKGGYLREALTNYIALLGWAYDDSREFFSLGELEQCFDLTRLSRSPATFDYQKLEWFNGQYIRQRSISQLKEELAPLWQEQLPEVYAKLPAEKFSKSLDWILPLLQERLKFLCDAPAMAAYFFARPEYREPELALPKKHSPTQAAEILALGRRVLERLLAELGQSWQDFEGLLQVKQGWEAAFREAAGEAGIKMGALMQPLRYAITGSKTSPPLLESMLILQHSSSDDEGNNGAELLARIDALARQLAALSSGIPSEPSEPSEQ